MCPDRVTVMNDLWYVREGSPLYCDTRERAICVMKVSGWYVIKRTIRVLCNDGKFHVFGQLKSNGLFVRSIKNAKRNDH